MAARAISDWSPRSTWRRSGLTCDWPKFRRLELLRTASLLTRVVAGLGLRLGLARVFAGIGLRLGLARVVAGLWLALTRVVVEAQMQYPRT